MEKLKEYMEGVGYNGALAEDLVAFIANEVAPIRNDPFDAAIGRAFDRFFETDETSVERSTIVDMVGRIMDERGLPRPRSLPNRFDTSGRPHWPECECGHCHPAPIS